MPGDVYVPTPLDVVAAMLDVAGLVAGERHLDLGSGDGRLCAEAARRGAVSVGIEADAELARKSRERMPDGVTIFQGDFWFSPLQQYNVVTAVVSDGLRAAVREWFCAVGRPGARLVFGPPIEVVVVVR